MKNLIKSRRGIAIELAIGAMLIMMALSIVLVSISGMQNRHKESDLEAFVNKIEVYEIMDSIENDLKQNVNPFSEIETDAKVVVINQKEYTVSLAQSTTNENITENIYTISKGERIILTLEIKTVTDDDANVTTNTITSWRD